VSTRFSNSRTATRTHRRRTSSTSCMASGQHWFSLQQVRTDSDSSIPLSPSMTAAFGPNSHFTNHPIIDRSLPLTHRALHATDRFTEQIKKLQRNGTVDHEISICWVPRRTLVSNKILEDEGVLGDLNVSELPLFFLPLEDDLFSLESENAFSDLYLVRLSCPIDRA
jgi:hypothetical protein